MKLRNILFGIMLMFISINVVQASDEIVSYFDVKGSDLYQINSSKHIKGSSIQMAYKKNANGDIIYCTERQKASVHTNTMRYTYTRELSDRFVYIMENGYPNKTIFGDAEKDYFTTSLAIWYVVNPNDSEFTYFDLKNGTYRGTPSDVVREMANLVYESINANYGEPYITINASNKDLTLSSDGKYYVSSNINIKENGVYKYTVSSDNNNVIITDTNGNVKNKFKYNESFIVKVDASSISDSTSVNIKVSANGTINKAYEYSPNNTKYQSVTMLVGEGTPVNDSTNFNITITKKPEISISKKDITNSKELAGASLELRNEKGELIYAWISTDEPFIIKDGLEAGKYTLTEILAPEGYELNKESVTFTVNTDGTVNGDIVMYNKPQEVVEVPSTSSFKTMTTSLIGLLIIGFGSLVIYRNYKKNEEV